MAWTYLAELEGSPLPWDPGCARPPIVKSSDTPKLSYFAGWPAEPYHLRPSGGTSETWVPIISKTLSKSFMAASPARTSALQELEQAWKAADQVYFSKSFASLANFDRDSFSWKTSQLSLFGGLTAFSWSSLRWGTIVDGRLYQPQRWEPRTSESAGSYLPTPMASEGVTNQTDSPGATVRPSLGYMAKHKLWPTPRTTGLDGGSNSRNAAKKRGMWPTPWASEAERGHGGLGGNRKENQYTLSQTIGGQLNPTWVEWLMGYPSGWTVLDPWAMQWFRSKPAKRSKD